MLSEGIRLPCFDASMERLHLRMKALESLIRLRYASRRPVGRSPSSSSNTYFIFIMLEQIKLNQLKSLPFKMLACSLALLPFKMLACWLAGMLACLFACLFVCLFTCLSAYLPACLLSRPEDPICFFKCDHGSKECTGVA